MRRFTDKVTLATLPGVIWLYLHLTRLTSRIDVYGSHHPDRLKESGTGFTFAFWHNRQIILPVIRGGDRIHCLISSSRDGEYIARVARLFGKETIRGSSTRGGFEAMKQIMRVLESGGIVAVTPDGPLGPKREVKPGIIQLSRALGTPIVPIAFDASRKKVFGSWDRFNLPYPFSRIAVVFGEPMFIGASESVEAGCARLKETLDDVVEQASRKLAD